jgi:hypothetical protein
MLWQEFSKTIQEILAILIVEEYLATLYPSDNDVMQDTGSAAPPFTGLRPRNRAFFTHSDNLLVCELPFDVLKDPSFQYSTASI